MNLADRIEAHLLAAGGWVAASDLCERFGITERSLRQHGDAPGILDHFAVSSTSSGYIHQKYLTRKEWLPIKHRRIRHALSELRRVRRWAKARHNVLTGAKPLLMERHTGQILLLQP